MSHKGAPGPPHVYTPSHQERLAKYHFKKGHEFRRRNAGRNLRDWITTMDMVDADGNACFDEDRLRKIAKDKKAQPSKRAAAKMWLATLEEAFSKAGKRLAGDDLDRIMDRTEGRPMMRMETSQARPPRHQLIAQFRQLIERNPEIMGPVKEEMEQRIRKQLEAQMVEKVEVEEPEANGQG